MRSFVSETESGAWLHPGVNYTAKKSKQIFFKTVFKNKWIEVDQKYAGSGSNKNHLKQKQETKNRD